MIWWYHDGGVDDGGAAFLDERNEDNEGRATTLELNDGEVEVLFEEGATLDINSEGGTWWCYDEL